MYQTRRKAGSGPGPAWVLSCVLAFGLQIGTGTVASAEPWLQASSSVSGATITVVLRNDSPAYLHTLDPNRWVLNNYVKVGTEVRPLWPGHDSRSSSEERPDLDGVMASVKWARIELGPDGLAPGTSVIVDIPRPAGLRGQVDVVVLARKRGSEWLTLRETVTTQILVPGDGWRLLAWAGFLGASLLFARRPLRPGFSQRQIAAHSSLVIMLAAIAIARLDELHYREFPHSDGVNYAVVARSVAEGSGLVSPVVQPGLIGLARTDERGQAFVIQAPGWPLVLAQAFRLFGATPRVETMTGYLFVALAALGAFWLAALSTQSLWAGYMGAAFDLSGPWVFGTAVSGGNAPLQSLLILALFLLLFRRPTPSTMAVAGLISGLGLVVRETMLFAIAGFLIAAWWHDRNRAHRVLGGPAILAFSLLLMAPWLVDRERRARVAPGGAFPTVTATLLYGTSQMDSRWYWRESIDWSALRPVEYLVAHPRELISKIRGQVFGVFLHDILPKVFSFSPMLLPLAWPFFIARERRAAGLAVMISLGLFVIGGSLSFLHPAYVLCFLPALAGLVAASLDGILRRLGTATQPRRAGLVAAAGYALLPLVVNLEAIGKAGAVDVGEYPFGPSAVQRLCAFTTSETPAGSVIAIAHHPASLVAWYVRRSFLQYDPAADTRIGPTPMWGRILARIPVDYILLTSFMEKGDEPLPDGFFLRATLNESGIRAWLYERSNRAVPAGR